MKSWRPRLHPDAIGRRSGKKGIRMMPAIGPATDVPHGPVRLEIGIPILRIFDEAKAREFYLDFLDFHLDWEHRFAPDLPLYCQVSRSGLMLHLSEHHG